MMKWPNLVAYDVNFALNEDEPFDGVGIVCFDTKEAAERAFQTLEGSSARSAAIAETGQNAIFLAEEVVIVPGAKPARVSLGFLGWVLCWFMALFGHGSCPSRVRNVQQNGHRLS
jgi:hypothetical protein